MPDSESAKPVLSRPCINGSIAKILLQIKHEAHHKSRLAEVIAGICETALCPLGCFRARHEAIFVGKVDAARGSRAPKALISGVVGGMAL
jgi:hypothetical protein